jgi:serine/threonine protein kinase
MQLHGLLSRASDLVEMGFERGREMGEAAAKVAADTAKAAADTALAASSKSVMIEERQYLLLGLIAEGGFAYVYRARDAASGEKLAVKKVIAQDRAAAEIAETELRFLRTLPPHPNIIRLKGGSKQPSSTGSGHEYLFAIELCSGGALTKHVQPGARWPILPLTEPSPLADPTPNP